MHNAHPVADPAQHNQPSREVLSAFGSTAVLCLISVFSKSSFPAILALCAFGFFFYKLATWSPCTFVLALPLSILFLTEIFSLALIECGAFMFEVGDYGEATGATARLSLAYMGLFLILGVLSERRLAALFLKFDPGLSNSSNKRQIATTVILSVSWATIAFLFVYGLANGFPIFTEQDRYAYRREFDQPAFSFVFANRLLITAVFSLLPLMGRQKAGLSLLGGLITVSILFSEKFTSILQIIVIYYIPILLTEYKRTGRVRVDKAAGLLAVIAAITVPVVLVVYGARDDFEGAVEKLASRVAVQGQMWFVIDRDHGGLLNFNSAAAKEEALSLLSFDDKTNTDQLLHGRYAVMQGYVDEELLRWVMEIDQGFVFTLVASWQLNYGYAGAFLLTSATALVFAVFLQLFSLTLAQKAFIWFAAGYTNGYSYLIFGIKMAVLLVVCTHLARLSFNRPTGLHHP
jgi:hypothetical protein